MSNELAKIDFGKAEVIRTLKATVAAGLTDPEFAIFAEHCKSTGLNPFKKEVWAIKAGGRLQVMTGVAGFMSIANSHPEFDGMEVGLIDEKGGYQPLTYTEKFVGAWCKVHRKDRKFPAEAVAMLKEYKKSTPIWAQMERVMIAKCAKSVAIREAFPQELNGLYAQEEMPPEYTTPGNTIELTPASDLVNEKTGEIVGERSDLELVYAVPYNATNKAGELWRQVLKRSGFNWDGKAKAWTGKMKFPELEQYLVGGNQDDDIPEAFYEGDDDDEE